MNRAAMLERVRASASTQQPWDILVIGGGATGAGIAVDAASRGFQVLLLEREDFGKGTSSRSTKLVHGGVRYLEQGNVPLVMEALRERGLLRRNAPHLVHDMGFLIPNYRWWETPFFGIGMKVYDLLAGRYGFDGSKVLSRAQALALLPTLDQAGLRGGVLYHDGQFDDARLLIQLMETAADAGATVLNYAPVVALHKNNAGTMDGASAIDTETGECFDIKAKIVINATGVFTDQLRRLADSSASSLVSPSQGIHLVLPRAFLPGATALMVPHTSDGRVLFAIPWHEHIVVGTTDTPIDQPSYEPRPLEQEIDFVLQTAGEYLTRPPTRTDVLSVFVGIRPLVKAAGPKSKKTAALSRDHTLHIDPSGLLTIVGGKWTTYRHMAEDAVNHAIPLGKLPRRSCTTRTLPIHGFHPHPEQLGSLAVYGADAAPLRALAEARPELARQLHPELPYLAAEVVWAARMEMARTLEDVLARRTRALFLNARAALQMAPEVASLLAQELGRDDAWIHSQGAEFQTLAAHYTLASSSSAAAQSLAAAERLA